ncbi:MAG TPA: Hsp20/alpha crystallin family protein [Chitinophagaceae bacterium]|nr:Hsp20/alpha crystallin family protein [Chitinophagaceae bacterium]
MATTTIAKRQNGNRGLSFGNVFDNIFQNSLQRFVNDDWADENFVQDNVPVNIRETDKAYQMDVVAPGCKKEDFNINISNNLLTVSFEQKEEKNQQDEDAGWVRNEYRKRSFSRSFSLDDTVDVNKINASYTDGILHVMLPKNEKAQKITRNIDIK